MIVAPRALRAIDHPLGVIHRRRPRRLVRRKRVFARWANHAHSAAFKADLVKLLAKPGIVIRRAFKHRDFHRVITRLLDALQNGRMFAGDMGRPEQQVKSRLHRKPLKTKTIKTAFLAGFVKL